MNELISTLLPGVISGAFVALINLGILKTELKYLRRDTDHAHKRIDSIESNCRAIHQKG